MKQTPSVQISIRTRHSPVIDDAVRGDPEALSAVLAVARPMVYRWVLARTKDVDDAEDVTQMVLLRVHSRLSVFRGDSLLSSWLYRVTINELSGFFRKEAREQVHSRRWGETQVGEVSPPPTVDAIANARAAGMVRDVAENLPPLQQAAFQLVDVDGLRPCEAARELGKTQTTIRSSLCRARRRIRALVEECQNELARDWLELHGMEGLG